LSALAITPQTPPAQWAFLAVPFLIFGASVAALALKGDPGTERSLLGRVIARINSGLEGVTGLPGWAMATVGVGLFGLLLAAVGFYWDVGWHIDLGRDKQLFTPPHTLILLGLGSILAASVVAVEFATISRRRGGWELRGRNIPWSAVPLAVIGLGALTGFPLDDLWHHFYGIDVTMWGPTHLIMIGGAAITPIALWLVLADAGIKPSAGRPAFLVHLFVGSAALVGLSALQGEFDFGVPQFQLLYHPVLIAGAAAVVLITGRMVLGRGGAIQVALGFIAIRALIFLVVGPGLGLTTPHFPLYLASALAVEAAALMIPPERRVSFALAGGLGIATVGLAGEWAWIAIWGRHPWTSAVLPEAIVLVVLAALGGAVIGGALGTVISGRAFRLRPGLALAAALSLALALSIPFPRQVGQVRGDLTLEPVGDRAVIHLTLDPPDAAEDARWFEALSWQGQGRLQQPMIRSTDGTYTTERPVPVTGDWKTFIRLHRGNELMALPVYLPADPEVGATEIPAQDRNVLFVRDTDLLMREAHGGPGWPAPLIFTLLSLVVVAWLAALTFAVIRVGRDGGGVAEPRPLRPAGSKAAA
jgi:hypothetical protein